MASAEGLAKGYVDRVEIVRRDETIAVHPRSDETADFIYNPCSFDAVKMLLLARLENRPARLDLTLLPLSAGRDRRGNRFTRLSRAYRQFGLYGSHRKGA